MKQRILCQNPGARIVAFLVSASPAFGHPGHEHQFTPAQSPAHAFVEPQHFLEWAGAACLVLAFYKLGQALGGEARKPAHEKHTRH